MSDTAKIHTTSEIRFTPDQEKAISAAGQVVLVSAAAGSGKTAVLCERILRRLKDEEHPGDLSRMLIVTFTRAAAGELRGRLSRKISEALAVDPENRHLRRQASLLPGARISTIHSFCLELIRSNFQTLGISASVRVMDEGESAILSRKVMNECIDRFYEKDDAFEALADLFVSDRDDTLCDHFLRIYQSLTCEPEGLTKLEEWADLLEDSAEKDFFTTLWGKEIQNRLRLRLEFYRDSYDRALECFAQSEPVFRSYGAAYRYDRDFIEDLYEATGQHPEAVIRCLQNYAPPRCMALKSEYKDEEVLRYADLRSEFGKLVKDRKKLFLSFSASPESLHRCFFSTAKHLRTLSALQRHYEETLWEEKKRIGAMDFTDMERMAISLLRQDDGSPSALAVEVQSRFDEVCIDEYQDVSRSQDQIFRLIAPKNRFMVGDVKQSIYGFRGACPELFSAYRSAFSDREEEAEEGLKIFLSENFRCDRRVIAFSNAVFRELFSVSTTIDYCPEDDLRYGKKEGEKDLSVEVLIADRYYQKDQDFKEEASRRRVTADDEADMLTGRIAALLSEGRKPGEIAVLVRSLKTTGAVLIRAFQKAGIPFSIGYEDPFDRRPEILLLHSLLQVIDNPYRDIPLVAAMKSPLFGFDLDDLAGIRLKKRKGHFYTALRKMAEEEGKTPLGEKCRVFLQFLEHYRRLEATLTPDRLILLLLEDSSLLPMLEQGLTPEEARVCRGSVMRLYDMARNYSEHGSGGLCGFLSHLARLFGAGFKGKGSQKPDSVQIMTVHNSKGLEFPVCILFGSGSRFSRRQEELPFDRSLGPAFSLRDDSGFGKISSPLHLGVHLASSAASMEEEMRILYVALTRAKQKLIVTGAVEDCAKTLQAARFDAKILGKACFTEHDSALWWILLTMQKEENRGLCRIYENPNRLDFQGGVSENSQKDIRKEKLSPRVSVAVDPEILETIRRRFSFVYPGREQSLLPAKLSVSRLSPSVLDESESGQDLLRATDFKTPSFAAAEGGDRRGADKGTATHVFMQFCDFHRVEKEGVDSELQRLTREGFLPSSMAELVDKEALQVFFASPLFAQMKIAPFLRREQRFNISLPAAAFTRDTLRQKELAGAQILVQGVIDCFFEDAEGRLWLFDYKTDRLSLSEREDPALGEAVLIERHKTQLSYYAAALERICRKPVDICAIWSFSLGRLVYVPKEDISFFETLESNS